MDFQLNHIDDKRLDNVIKPFIIVNGTKLYLKDGYITNNGIKEKVEFFYQSENEIAHINFKEAIGAITNGRIGIADVYENEFQDNGLIPFKPKTVDRGEAASLTSSVDLESSKRSSKLNKEVRPKILTYGKHTGILNKRRPMPKCRKGLKLSPDVIEFTKLFANKNADFIKLNETIDGLDCYEEDDKYLMKLLYKLQPIVKITVVDLMRLKRKYNSSKIKTHERGQPHTDYLNNGSRLLKLKENKSRTEANGTRRQKNIFSFDKNDSVGAITWEDEVDEEIHTREITKSPVCENVDSSKESLYVESSEGESESNMKIKSRKVQSKPIQSHVRAYSVGEDLAIVNHVLKSPLLAQVNGNVLWKELENEYRHLTNKYRTWHSLRNRFLKSIRFNLRDFHLSVSDVNKLRMATFKGASKKLTPAIVLPQVISAHGRKRHKHGPKKSSHTTKADPTQGTDEGDPSNVSGFNKLDSSTPQDKAPKKNYPTYTNIIKDFEAQQKEDMESDSSVRSNHRDDERKCESDERFKSYLKKGSRKLYSHQNLL